jgi:predicted dehydrogenase
MAEPVRFALVGAGGIAQTYAQALESCDAARLVAVADIRAEAARALAERFDCPHFDGYRSLAEQGPPYDAVIVCTPPNTHEEISVPFLQRGTHVLCEKPFALDAASARRMLDAARHGSVRLTMASKFRYVDDVVRAKSIVASGILGEIILFENAFTSRVDMAARWNADPAVSGGGVLIDNGAHSVDLMRYFLGPLADVQVIEGKRVQGLSVEDTVRIFVHSSGGVMGSIDLSWSISKELDSYLSIYGSQGTVLVGWKESKYRQISSRDWVVFGRGYDKVQAFRSQIINFARTLRGEDLLRITAEDALASVEVIEAAYQSLRQQHWTNITPPVGQISNLPPPGRLETCPTEGKRNGKNGSSAVRAIALS